MAPALVPVRKECGDDLSREGIMRQLASIKDQVPMLSALKWNTSRTGILRIDSARLARLDGRERALFGKMMGR